MRRALHALLARAAALLPAPALADVTARYTFRDAKIVIEAADNGNSRVDIDGKHRLWIVRRDGIDYVVLRDSDGEEHAALAEGAFARLLGPTPQAAMAVDAVMGGSDTVAGYSGTVWQFGPRGEAPIELLMSPDPRLAPIGAVCLRLVEPIFGRYFDREALRKLFAAGTPLRIGPAGLPAEQLILFESASFDPVDPKRFAVPGPLIPAADLADLLSPPPVDVIVD